MIFGGIQELTLLDYPDKTACTVFAAGCNFDCPFCQNSSLISPAGKNKTKSESEILTFLETRKGLLDGVCISGGEPMIQGDLEAFIDKVKALGFLVKLDTNGSCPGKLEKLMKSGAIDYVAMDIKNTPEKYAQTTGKPGYDVSPVKESVELLLSGDVPYEFRTTVVREFHTEGDLLSVASWVCGAGKYYLQKFINSDGVSQSGLSSYSDEEMRQLLSSILKIMPGAALRGV